MAHNDDDEMKLLQRPNSTAIMLMTTQAGYAVSVVVQLVT